MNRFFRIVFPDKKSVVVVSTNGYAGLIDLVDGVEDKENTYIVPVSLFEVIKYTIMKCCFMRWHYGRY